MELSVVVPTLNGREQLARCLDAVAEHAPAAEVVVVNGPSTDGTTGMVRDRDDVDVLVEMADRNINAARNAGLAWTVGDVVALLNHDHTVQAGWLDALREAVAEGADGVSGPTHRPRRAGVETEEVEDRTIAGREVTYFNSENFALTRAAVDALDGFDEYLETGGARDAAHRLTGMGHDLVWEAAMSVRREVEPDGGLEHTAWGWRYRSLAYRLVKNYGLRPTVVRRVARHAGADALDALRDVARGEGRPSSWFGNGRDVLAGATQGAAKGVVARFRDRTSRRNPNGMSTREDRAVAVYDRR
jgi:glycosyltransferase involved in cell wall biosynthesis